MLDFYEHFVDKHEGKTCIILGNGPSINDYDLNDPFFTDNITIGSNAIGKVFNPTYYVIGDYRAYYKFAERYALNGKSILFVSHGILNRYVIDFTRVYLVYYNAKDRIGPPTKYRIYNGRTSGIVMIHMAYQMGFSRIFLLGIDGYAVEGSSHFFNTTNQLPGGSDEAVSKCLVKIVNVFREEKIQIWDLSIRSVHGKIKKWKTLPDKIPEDVGILNEFLPKR